MSNYYKYFYFVLGVSVLFNFFSVLLKYNNPENYLFLGFETSKLGYLVFKFIIGAILIVAGILEMKKVKNTKLQNKP